MEIHRRSFLISLLAAPAIVKVSSLDRVRGFIVPTLWGDGIRNDTTALQAMADCLPYFSDGKLIQRAPHEPFRLLNGRYRITDTILVKNSDVLVSESVFSSEISPAFCFRNHSKERIVFVNNFMNDLSPAPSLEIS